jgi:ATP-dependent Clp protease ATP-binding subunit ClpC
MFERFSDRARQVVVQAQAEARSRAHNYIGTEHILLALVHEGIGGVAPRTLESMQISADAVRQQIDEIVGRGSAPAQTRHIAFTPRAKKVLELSLHEALQLGHHYIDRQALGCRGRGRGGAGRRRDPHGPAGIHGRPAGRDRAQGQGRDGGSG